MEFVVLEMAFGGGGGGDDGAGDKGGGVGIGGDSDGGSDAGGVGVGVRVRGVCVIRNYTSAQSVVQNVPSVNFGRAGERRS